MAALRSSPPTTFRLTQKSCATQAQVSGIHSLPALLTPVLGAEEACMSVLSVAGLFSLSLAQFPVHLCPGLSSRPDSQETTAKSPGGLSH